MTIIKVRCGLTWLPEHRRDKGKPPILQKYLVETNGRGMTNVSELKRYFFDGRPEKIDEDRIDDIHDLVAEKLYEAYDIPYEYSGGRIEPMLEFDSPEGTYLLPYDDGEYSLGTCEVTEDEILEKARDILEEENNNSRKSEGIRVHQEKTNPLLDFRPGPAGKVFCYRCHSAFSLYLPPQGGQIRNFIIHLADKHPKGTTLNMVDFLHGFLKHQNIKNLDLSTFAKLEDVPVNLLACLFFHEGMTRGIADRLFSPEQRAYLTNLIKNDQDCNRQVKAFINGLEPGEGGLEFLETFQ